MKRAANFLIFINQLLMNAPRKHTGNSRGEARSNDVASQFS
jgi:hypothetical protein